MENPIGPPSADEHEAPTWKAPPVRGHRSGTDRYLAGVVGGLGERWAVDTTILRVIVVAAAVGLRDDAPIVVPMLYVAGWIIVPAEGERSLIATANQRRSLQEIMGAVLGGVAGVAVAANSGLWAPGVLAAAAWLLLAEGAPTGGPGDEAPSPMADGGLGNQEASPVHGPADAASGRAARWGRARRGATAQLGPFPSLPTRTRRPRREPALWPLTLALLVAWSIACVAVDRGGDPGLDPAIAINCALIIVGGVLALSAWKGRAGWPTLLAVPLIPLWIAFSAGDVGRFAGDGSRSIEVLDRPDGGTVAIEHGYGTLDLAIDTEALPPGETLYVITEMTAGTISVTLPDNAPLIVRTRAGLGWVLVNGTDSFWQTDTATVIGQQRTRAYPALTHRCFVEPLPVREIDDRYHRWWVESMTDGPSSEVVVPDFTDPATVELAEVEEFLSWGAPEFAPDEGPDGLEWSRSIDDLGRPCDPDEPVVETGAVELDATIGLGEINVVRTID